MAWYREGESDLLLMLGMCPTLAVTSSAINGLGMGLSTTVVLVFSNLLISAFRKVIPNGVRMPGIYRDRSVSCYDGAVYDERIHAKSL